MMMLADENVEYVLTVHAEKFLLGGNSSNAVNNHHDVCCKKRQFDN
jgi:hypothetical protein